MKNAFLFTTLAFGALLYGCSEQGSSASGSWTAEIHPDAGTLSESRSLGEFPSYDDCMKAALEALGGSGVFNCSRS